MMVRTSAIAAVVLAGLTLALAETGLPSAATGTIPMGVTLSTSATDPFANVGPAVAGSLDVYLWLVCIAPPFDYREGTDSFWASLETPLGIQVSAFDAAVGLNAGDGPHVLMAFPCYRENAPLLLGVFHLEGAGEGSFCLTPHPEWGWGGWLRCDCLGCMAVGIPVQIGYTAGSGAPACAELLPCGPTPVDPNSWGRVKSLYR